LNTQSFLLINQIHTPPTLRLAIKTDYISLIMHILL